MDPDLPKHSCAGKIAVWSLVDGPEGLSSIDLDLRRFEPAERSFVEHLLRRGMTVLDIGAHDGFYTLLRFKVRRAKRIGYCL